MATVISVINFKGGVGKSTLAFHLAAHYAKKYRVLTIDVDHQSSLSIVMMGGVLWEKAVSEGRTSNRIFRSFCDKKTVMPTAEVIIKNPLHARQPAYDIYPNLDLLPAELQLDDTEIDMASTTMGTAILSEWNKRTLMCEWLDAIEVSNKYDVVVIDCPPATKLVSQNALAASNYFVIPVIPDAMSSRGVSHFRQLVKDKVDSKLQFLLSGSGVAKKDVPLAYVKDTELAAIVPFMAKPAGGAFSGLTNIHTEQLAALRVRWKNDVTKGVAKHLTGVAEAMDAGWPVWDMIETQNISRAKGMMTEICTQVAAKITL